MGSAAEERIVAPIVQDEVFEIFSRQPYGRSYSESGGGAGGGNSASSVPQGDVPPPPYGLLRQRSDSVPLLGMGRLTVTSPSTLYMDCGTWLLSGGGGGGTGTGGGNVGEI